VSPEAASASLQQSYLSRLSLICIVSPMVMGTTLWCFPESPLVFRC
jgi:hypothetical protein